MNRTLNNIAPFPLIDPSPPDSLADRLLRPLRDVRLSVTDRCNFRCTYCMPRELFGPDHAFLPRRDILTYEELARLAAVFARLGARKFRLTGGEPLLRRDIDQLVARLRAAAPNAEITLTTNGSLLRRHASALRAAGLDRVTVSLDALDDPTFQRMNDAGVPVREVLDGIDAAVEAGFRSVKINAVVRRGVNEHAVPDLAARFAGTDCIVRFIEYMDVGNTNGWRLDDVVPAAEIVAMLESSGLNLTPLPAGYRGEVARRYQTPGGGEIGIITSVTMPFCRDCTRARLSSEGKLFTCLFAADGLSLRDPLRSGASDDELASIISKCWTDRDDRYSELRSAATGSAARKVEMSAIGG